MNYNFKDIGKRIAKERKEYCHLSQDELLLKLSKMRGIRMNRNTLSAIENGKCDRYDSEFLFALCELFDCELGYLLCEYKCKTGRNTDISVETGLSEKAIEELRYIALLDDALSEEPDLHTINILLEQLSSQYNNVIHAITDYLRSNGLSKDTWYDIRSKTLSEKKPPMITDRIHIPAHSDTFDNLLLMDIQNRITNLKSELKKASSQ